MDTWKIFGISGDGNFLNGGYLELLVNIWEIDLVKRKNWLCKRGGFAHVEQGFIHDRQKVEKMTTRFNGVLK